MKEKNILFFDGVCNLCNSSVEFFFKRNKKRTIYFSSLQSDFAHSFLKEYSIYSTELNTVYYYSNGELYLKSTAILMALKELSIFYRFFLIFLLIPVKIRDRFYDYVAKRRYKMFGKSNNCRLPSDGEKDYFIP